MYSNGFFDMMIYTHKINTSLESNNEYDDDVIDLLTFFICNCIDLKFFCKYKI